MSLFHQLAAVVREVLAVREANPGGEELPEDLKEGLRGLAKALVMETAEEVARHREIRTEALLALPLRMVERGVENALVARYRVYQKEVQEYQEAVFLRDEAQALLRRSERVTAKELLEGVELLEEAKKVVGGGDVEGMSIEEFEKMWKEVERPVRMAAAEREQELAQERDRMQATSARWVGKVGEIRAVVEELDRVFERVWGGEAEVESSEDSEEEIEESDDNGATPARVSETPEDESGEAAIGVNENDVIQNVSHHVEGAQDSDVTMAEAPDASML